MEQKHRFVALAATGRITHRELCLDFQVRRKVAAWTRDPDPALQAKLR